MLKQIDKWFNDASDMAITVIESKARNILKQHSNLNEFVMCMGTFFFTSKKQINFSTNNIIDPVFKYMEPFYEMVWELNERFNVTGCPMRFTVNGKVISNW
jgi:hypothetical protein